MAAEPGGGRARFTRCWRPPLAAFTAGLLLLLLLPPSASASSSSCDHRVPSGDQVGRPRVFRWLRRELGSGGSPIGRSRSWIRPFSAFPGRAVPGLAPPPRLWVLMTAGGAERPIPGEGRVGKGWKGLALSGAAVARRSGGPGAVGCYVCPGELPHPAPHASPCQVVYQVPLKENHVSKRNVDQQLRIKIVYDRSVEE